MKQNPSNAYQELVLDNSNLGHKLPHDAFLLRQQMFQKLFSRLNRVQIADQLEALLGRLQRIDTLVQHHTRFVLDTLHALVEVVECRFPVVLVVGHEDVVIDVQYVVEQTINFFNHDVHFLRIGNVGTQPVAEHVLELVESLRNEWNKIIIRLDQNISTADASP